MRICSTLYTQILCWMTVAFAHHILEYNHPRRIRIKNQWHQNTLTPPAQTYSETPTISTQNRYHKQTNHTNTHTHVYCTSFLEHMPSEWTKYICIYNLTTLYNSNRTQVIRIRTKKKTTWQTINGFDSQ